MLPSTAVLAGNTLLRPLANWINRRPITAAVTETDYQGRRMRTRVDIAPVALAIPPGA